MADDLQYIVEQDMSQCVYYRSSTGQPYDAKQFCNYLIRGCFSCKDGHDTACESYLPVSALYNISINGINRGDL